ncbi:MAG TPA: CHASE2 domain-containing protein [Bacteroidota bacterium]|nr:CHASE2 domain-containing protein [Bacteroidota bacterium]
MAASSSKPARTIAVNLAISLAVTACVLLLTQDILFEFPPLRRAELAFIDLRFRERGNLLTSRDTSQIVIVEISQESFKSLPDSWPWPKRYYTRLIRNLHRAGAKVVGLDVVFSSLDSRTPWDNQDFRSALKEVPNVVLAGKLETERHQYVKRDQLENYGNAFIDSTTKFGIVNTRSDYDGVVRRYMPFVYDDATDKRIPTFSMSLLNVVLHQAPEYTAEVGEQTFHYVAKEIPRYDATSFLINYYGPSGTFRRVKFADVLDDKDFRTREETSLGVDINTFDDTSTVPTFDGKGVQPAGYLYNGTFANKIVLVGSTNPEDKDLFPVTVGENTQEGDNQMYGVEIHANVIQNILHNDFILRQPYWMTALVVFGLSLFTFVFTAGLKAIRTRFGALIEILGVAIICSELFIIYWASLKLFNENNYLADMTSPFTAVIICYIGSTVYNYVTERKQKILIKSMFSRYVSPTVVDELVAHPEKLRLGGERKELTVMFSDIEKFTNMAERMMPEELVMILNEYLSSMTDIIIENHGTLDKYQGDAIVAFWGAPAPQQDHAIRACRAALTMQESLIEMRKRWQSEGKPPLNVRIGISTGEMVVGNMGGEDRFDYTVIGDSVNLGARLEGANKQYKTQTMISEETYRQVREDVLVRELDLLVVSGKTEPIRVYELIGMVGDSIPSQMLEFVAQYTRGLNLYRQRRWDEAIASFEKARKFSPDDYPCHIYIERSRMYQSTPPPANWNGVFILRVK